LAGQAAGAAEDEGRKLSLGPQDKSRKVVLDLFLEVGSGMLVSGLRWKANRDF
jgi:hypothetical protein